MKKYSTFVIIFFAFLTGSMAQNFYDINTINTVEITFDESNWDYLLDQLYAAGEEERLLGSVSINGEVFDSVGVRYKGNSTYSANQIKNPLNIKLDYVIDDQEIEGYGTLKLANVYKDPSFVREALGFEIARKYFPASESNFVNVYINGTHLGLYASDQSVDKFFMNTHFGGDENTRVKGEITSTTPGPPSGGVWEYFGSDSASYSGYYDMKSDYGWSELIDFLNVLNNEDDVDDYLNVDRHLWFLAFSNLLVNLDGPINNPQNYYLYKDNSGRFNPIPWDLNESFGVFAYHQTLGPLSTYQLQNFSPTANLNANDFPVISEILNHDEYMKIYVAHMKTIIEENFENNLYEERALEIQDIIGDDVQADQNKFYSYANFVSNINTQVGGGNQSVIGITQLMDSRVDYITSLSQFQYDSPVISNASHTPEEVSPNTEIWFNTEVEDADDVYLSFRSDTYSAFEKVLMYDDGNHEDEQAGDGIYGVAVIAGSSDIQYYIFAENSDAVAFLPVRAEYEFFDIDIIFTAGDLVINEFMADNENFITDQDGDYDDWIELYNNGDSEISLEGYYLSDDATDPDKWMFPDTLISAGGYLIVWADKDEEQEGLHASFKLSASGESVILSNESSVVIDEISYLEQFADTTYGRYVNGTGDFIYMMPTFEYANNNVLTTLFEGGDQNSFELKQNYPNPFSTSTTIDFILEDNAYVELKIYNGNGMVLAVLASQNLSSGEYSYQWNYQGVSKGFFLYSLTVDGVTTVKKMIKQ